MLKTIFIFRIWIPSLDGTNLNVGGFFLLEQGRLSQREFPEFKKKWVDTAIGKDYSDTKKKINEVCLCGMTGRQKHHTKKPKILFLGQDFMQSKGRLILFLWLHNLSRQPWILENIFQFIYFFWINWVHTKLEITVCIMEIK